MVRLFGDLTGDHSAVFAEHAEEKPEARQAQVARREEKAVVVEERLRAWNAHLRRRESELEARERRAEFLTKVSARAGEEEIKVGRNALSMRFGAQVQALPRVARPMTRGPAR